MPRIVTDKANFFKQLSIYSNNALEELTKLQSAFTAKLLEITNAFLAIADAEIEYNNKLQALTAKQLQAIAADAKADINELKARLLAGYESYSNQITELKLDTLAPHSLIASATNHLQQHLDEGLMAAADLMCRALNDFMPIQHDANQQQIGSLLKLLHFKSQIKIELDRLKTKLKQQIATAVLQILQTKNKWHGQPLAAKSNNEALNDMLLELEQELQLILVQARQGTQQLIRDAEQAVEVYTFSAKDVSFAIKHAQAKAHKINQHLLDLEQRYKYLLKKEMQAILTLLKQHVLANDIATYRATNNLLMEDPLIDKQRTVRSDIGAVFIRKKVADDGDCGFTAFGITRQHAIDLLLANIVNNQQVVRLLQQPLREVMFQEKFSDYIAQHNMFPNYTIIFAQLIAAEISGDPISSNQLRAKLNQYINDTNFLSCYINYDVRDKKVDAGWAHPAVLQALAEIRGLRLNIFTINEQFLMPHELYPRYNEHAEQEINLLFVHGNHFERLELLDDNKHTNEIFEDRCNNDNRISKNALLFSSKVNNQDLISDVPPLEHRAINSTPGF